MAWNNALTLHTLWSMRSDRTKSKIINGGQACKPDFVRRAGVAAIAPWRSFL